MHNEKTVIGITGGVGSGKSTVLDILEQEYGAYIIQADAVARELMEPGEVCYQAVVRAFGPDILQEDDNIDRKALASLIFNDDSKRLLLNSLTHPLVEQEIKAGIEAAHGLVVLEAALPEEAGFSRLCDAVWYIHAPEETRIERLMSGRGYTREKCLQIMASQLSEEDFRRLASVVIENGATPDDTRVQIKKQIETEGIYKK